MTIKLTQQGEYMEFLNFKSYGINSKALASGFLHFCHNEEDIKKNLKLSYTKIISKIKEEFWCEGYERIIDLGWLDQQFFDMSIDGLLEKIEAHLINISTDKKLGSKKTLTKTEG